MATLEKIRNKSVLLFIIIIVALLAFILGDFLTSGRTYFGHPTTVAKAGGATVEYQDYQNRLAQAGEQLRGQGREYSNDVLTQTVVQSLLTEQLFKQEYERLGIKVTDAELTEAMTGENPHPAAAQMIGYLSQQLQLPEASGRAVYDAMQNPAKYGLRPELGDELRKIWASQEQELEANMLNQKFMSLVTGLFTYNKLDAKSFYDDNATTRHIAYVNKDASAVADDEIEFTDADVKALWNAQKANYRIDEETREINYIYVPIEPSQADRIAGQQVVEDAIAGLNETAGTEAVAQNSRFVVSTANLPLSRISDNRLKTFVNENEKGQAKLLNRDNDTYTIAKILDVTTGIDSINVSMLRAIEGTNLDSIVNVLNSGASFASLSDGASIQGQDSIWTALEGVGLEENIKGALTNATVGKAFIFTDTIQGTPVSAVYKVNRRHAPVNYYDIATIEYTVDPSQETLNDLTSALRTYVSNNSSADEFVKNATEAGYSVLSDQVSNSSTGIGNATDSRRFVKWAMEAKKGKVSPMMQDDKQSYIIAVAVTDIYDDFIPYTSPAVNTQLTAQARNAKKADKLMADYAGKASDLAGYAKAMDAEVNEGNVNITTPTLLSIGFNESALQGAIAAAEKGKLVGPVKGNRGILVFEVRDINTDNRPFTEAEYGQRFNQTFGLTRQATPLPLLLGKEKVDNRSLNFVQAVGE
ncbi:MAG: SurA N-terminal domain-containing protein [Muribaculaceae bacterium]|nr:SurA N-terminal domain-containing protein [Muribaculaceae bacterium]